MPSRRREAHAAPGEGWGLAVRPRLQRVLLPGGCSGGSVGAAGAIREFVAAPEPPAAPAASAGSAMLLFCLKLSSLQPALAESLGLGPLSFCWASPGPAGRLARRSRAGGTQVTPELPSASPWHAGAAVPLHNSPPKVLPIPTGEHRRSAPGAGRMLGILIPQACWKK